MYLKEEIDARWFLNQYTSEDLFSVYEKWWETLYFGVDPTAKSLHLGNFVVFMNAINFMKRWNKLILIVGSATGMIGDPSGKDADRVFLTKEEIAENELAIKTQVGRILENLASLSGINFPFEVYNNKDFYEGLGYLDFLREVGKYITVNQMMAKETVKRRIEDPDKSISYTEFSYMLLQGYDFFRLYTEKNCKLQISGSDQRWNIVTGIEIIKKKIDKEAYGVTSPLVLDSTGKKFGKSEGNALFLDPTMTTPFQIYQYFMNVGDEDVERYLKLFTLLSLEEIQAIVTKHAENPADRYGQEQLAKYVVYTLHGADAVTQAEKATAFLFGNDDKLAMLKEMSEQELDAIGKEVGITHIRESQASDNDTSSENSMRTIIDALFASGLETSRGNAKKDIEAGAIYLNEEKISDINTPLDSWNAINGYFVLRKGKKSYRLVKM